MSAHRIFQSTSKFSSLVVNRMATGRTIVQRQPAAFISTSKKNRDTTITADQTAVTTSPKTVEDFAKPSKVAGPEQIRTVISNLSLQEKISDFDLYLICRKTTNIMDFILTIRIWT